MKKTLIAKTAILCCSLLAAQTAFSTIKPRLIDRAAHQFMQRNNAPALAVAVYDRGTVKLFNYGVLNRDNEKATDNNTLFEIGSITKVFTATLLAEALNNGQIKLNQAIGNFLPQPLNKGDYAIDNVSFKQLATHTASLPKVPANIANPEDYNQAKMLQFLQQWQPRWPIGSKYVYSNLGFGILGICLAQVEQKPISILMSKQIFAPLSMNQTIDGIPTQSSNYATGYGKQNQAVAPFPNMPWRPGAGSIRSTNNDMAKFLQANIEAATKSDALSKAMSLAQQSLFNKARGGSIGLGWEIEKNPAGELVFSKGGRTNGFASYITFNPSKKIGVVVMTNKSNVVIRRIANFLLRSMGEPSRATAF